MIIIKFIQFFVTLSFITSQQTHLNINDTIELNNLIDNTSNIINNNNTEDINATIIITENIQSTKPDMTYNITVNLTDIININKTINKTVNRIINKYVNETDNKYENKTVNKTENDICYNYTDCFNCTINPKCRWNWTNEFCEKYDPYDEKYKINELNKDYSMNDIDALNSFVNFIRQACFLHKNPYEENKTIDTYNKISSRYCGAHYITTPLKDYKDNFRIELNNFQDKYGVPNILCEYIIVSGPNNFKAKINIDSDHANEFYLLYSEDSLNFNNHIKENQNLEILNTGTRANTFVFYGLKSFDSSPFKISFKEEKIDSSSSDTVGYILIALIVIISALIISSIIIIRKKSNLFKKTKKKDNRDESESIRSDNGLDLSEQKKIKDNKNEYLASSMSTNKNETKTPEELIVKNKDNFLSKKMIKNNSNLNNKEFDIQDLNNKE